MSAEQQPPLQRLWHRAREYLTHWAIAGVIVTVTGFAPDHIVAHMIHALHLDNLRDALPALDYRLLTVGLGVALIAVDVMVLNRKRQAAAPTAIMPEPEIIDAFADKPSIAVLPFVNMSDDKSQEYFADGMTEDIITGLSYDSRLFVIARNSTAAYKGQTPDVRAVGKELGVRYVLEGSIRPQNDMLRITVQLVETTSGAHVWADRIDRPIKEIFAISDAVVDGLVMALCSNLGAAEATRAGRARPEDLQAWALCVQAENIHASQLTQDTVLAAEKLVRRATEIEPAYGPGWAHLAYVITMRAGYGLNGDLDEARSLAAKALRLAPNDPMVLGNCGMAYVWTGQTAQAIDCLERSLALNPNNGLFRLRYGHALLASGDPEGGLAQIADFFRLSPKDPNAGIGHVWASNCYLALEDYPRAEEAARKAIKLLPAFPVGYVNLALSLSARGRVAEAAQAMRKLRDAVPGFTIEMIANNTRRFMSNPQQRDKRLALLDQLSRDMEADAAV
jgi:adenylate cyclase